MIEKKAMNPNENNVCIYNRMCGYFLLIEGNSQSELSNTELLP